ncbi:MAG TPA: YciI family protein [Kofleriaceae bacterium]|nr:YciI family protein [Kofleriaceae bacterium]
MRFVILCYDNQEETFAWSKEKDAQVMAQLGAVNDRLAAAGKLGPVVRLDATTKAKTLRKGKQAVILDGPFAETKEQLLGFYIVEAETMDEALLIGKDLAAASGSAGAFEIRPLMYYRGN